MVRFVWSVRHPQVDTHTPAGHAARAPVMATPTRRPLRVYPYDPELDRRGRSIVADVAFEHTEAGPAGRLVRVVDYDPVRRCFYEPVRLDSPEVLLNRGLDLAVHDPQFHQQMVYAVVMKVLEAFEHGLGRPFRWRGEQRLLVVPHAFEGQNAFFDEELFALLFGYFRAADNGGANVPGGVVYTCLSHDIIAHETTHAVIHRLRPGYAISTNLDVFGFHEGFSDIVALLHRFAYPDLVAEQLRESGARLEGSNPLVEFATQFGHAQGSGKPLRTLVEDPSPSVYADATEEHDRGRVLAAAVIDGFLRSYRDNVADLIRLATAGSGVLQPGALHPILVEQLTAAACATARNVLTICIRAFDFLPPVSITFGDYLRALVTADFELFPDDDRHYRANLIEAFRVRGIVPKDVASLADLSLRLEPCSPGLFGESFPDVQTHLLRAAQEFDRRDRARTEIVDTVIDDTGRADRQIAVALHRWADRHRTALGLDEAVPIRLLGFHANLRHDADGYPRAQLVAQFMQRGASDEDLGGIKPVGGTTVVANGDGTVRYVIAKPKPRDGEVAMQALKRHVADVEHRLGAAIWAGPVADASRAPPAPARARWAPLDTDSCPPATPGVGSGHSPNPDVQRRVRGCVPDVAPRRPWT